MSVQIKFITHKSYIRATWTVISNKSANSNKMRDCVNGFSKKNAGLCTFRAV